MLVEFIGVLVVGGFFGDYQVSPKFYVVLKSCFWLRLSLLYLVSSFMSPLYH